MGGEDRPVLQPVEHLGDERPIDGALLQGLTHPPGGGGQWALLGPGDLTPAVELLGDVHELKVGGEGPGQTHRGGVVDTLELGVQLVVAMLPREPPDPLHLREQLGSLVPGQRLTEQLPQLSHRRPKCGVLTVRGHPAGVLRHIRHSSLGLDQLVQGRLSHAGVDMGGTLLRHG